MAGKGISVFGIYEGPEAVEESVDVLRREGFRSADLSVLYPDGGEGRCGYERHSKAPEGAALGCLLGWLAGAFVGWVLALNGLIPAMAGRAPAAAALAGAGAGLLLGGLAGAALGFTRPEYNAGRYGAAAGRLLLSVHCDNRRWVRKAKDLLRRMRACDIGAAPEAPADFARSEKPRLRTRTSSAFIDR